MYRARCLHVRSRVSASILATVFTAAALSAATAQSSGGFEIVTPRSSNSPQAIQRTAREGDGFEVVAGAGHSPSRDAGAKRIAVAARPNQVTTIPPVQSSPAQSAAPLAPQKPDAVAVAVLPASPVPALAPPQEQKAETEAKPVEQSSSQAASAPADPPARVRDTDDANVKHVDVNHPMMLAARQRAQDGLDDFFRIGRKPPQGAGGFMLKVALHADGQTENIWVGALELRTRKKVFITVSESLGGRLANQPTIVKNRKIGDRITFSRRDIRDWMYRTSDRRIVGNYTACAIAAVQDPQALEAMARQYGLDCSWTAAIPVAAR